MNRQINWYYYHEETRWKIRCFNCFKKNRLCAFVCWLQLFKTCCCENFKKKNGRPISLSPNIRFSKKGNNLHEISEQYVDSLQSRSKCSSFIFVCGIGSIFCLASIYQIYKRNSWKWRIPSMYFRKCSSLWNGRSIVSYMYAILLNLRSFKTIRNICGITFQVNLQFRVPIEKLI